MIRRIQIFFVSMTLLLFASACGMCQVQQWRPDGAVDVAGSSTFASQAAPGNTGVADMVNLNFALLYGLDRPDGGIVADVRSGGKVELMVYAYDASSPDGRGKLIYSVYTDKSSEYPNFIASHADTRYTAFGLFDVASVPLNDMRLLAADATAYVGVDDCARSTVAGYCMLPYVLTRASKKFDNASGTFNQLPQECENYTPSQPVVIILKVRDAEVHSVKIPGIGELTPAQLFQPFSVKVVVYRHGAKQSEHTFVETGGNGKGIYDAASKVAMVAGDEVRFEINSANRPVIKGVPKIWLSGSMAQRMFMCTPDYGPDQVEPWCPFEIQTHYRMLNAYPKGDERNDKFIPVTRWDGNAPYVWTWIAQRETDPNVTNYERQVQYPKTKPYGSTLQRESQSIGWAKEVLNYWETNSSGFEKGRPTYTGPKYLLGYDVDEVLYINSKAHQTQTSEWENTTRGLVAINDYTNETNGKDNWQHMWPREEETVNGVKTYPIKYDNRGYPSGGETLNDLITAYQQASAYRFFQDPYSPYLNRHYYYNGYEIEDFGTFFSADLKNVITRTLDGPGECGENCWFHPHRSKGNNKHPGLVTVTAGGHQVQFRIHVSNPLTDNKLGFYNALSGPAFPLGFNQKSTFTLHGVPADKQQNFEIRMLSYNDGDGTVRIDSVAAPGLGKSATFKLSAPGAASGSISAEFPIQSGWSFFVAYYGWGNNKVPIAGIAPMVMDPLTSLTVPGTDPAPYSHSSEVTCPPGFVDLKEGQGERVLETQNELRKNPDTFRGYTQAYGATAFVKPYAREYVFRPGAKVKFSGIDAGRKIETFWPNKWKPKNTNDPYQSWRELSRRMPSDDPSDDDIDQPTDASKNIEYRLYKVEQASRTLVTKAVSRHFETTFSDVGEYELESNLKGFFEDSWIKPVTCKITVTPLDAQAHVETKFNENFERGKIQLRYLNNDEKEFLREHAGKDVNFDNYLVAEVKDILSEYAYVTGPRATNYDHRFGDQRDFNDAFVWYGRPQAASTSGTQVQPPPAAFQPLANAGFVTAWMNDFDPLALWPDDWGKNWVRHTSSNHFPVDEINKETVLRDNNDKRFSEILDFMFKDTEVAQKDLGFLRWNTWIAPTPTHGDKFNRWVKTAMDLEQFFNAGEGAFSGKPYVDILNVTNASEFFTWAGYGSMGAAPSKHELGLHFPDSKKNELEFYYHLQFGRMRIFENTDKVKEIEVFNEIPEFYRTDTESKVVTSSKIPKDLTKIFIGSTINNLPRNPDVNHVGTGIPVLTFEAAEYGRTELNTEYKISSPGATPVTTTVVHRGYDRYLSTTSKGLVVDLAVFGALCAGATCDGPPTPVKEYRDKYGVNGVQFKFKGKSPQHVNLKVTAYDDQKQTLNLYDNNGRAAGSSTLNVTADWQTYSIYFDANLASSTNSYQVPRALEFKFTTSDGSFVELDLDEFYLTATNQDKLTLPTDGDALWRWYQQASLQFFLRNYSDVTIRRSNKTIHAGAVPESATEPNKISIGGMGYAIACTMLATDKSLISDADAKARILKMVRWLYNLSPSNGFDGWYGVPWHYINRDYSEKAAYGTELGVFEEVSTIDWAMCMAAMRVARIRYQGSDSDSHEIRTMIDELINKTHWGRFRAKYKTRKLDNAGKPLMDDKNKPVMNEEDFKISMDVWIGGEPTKGRGMWGVAFSEETELVYAEAYATALEKQSKQNYKNNCSNGYCDDITIEYLDHITRKEKDGYYPSWFGAGFTYNWYQLWAGNYTLGTRAVLSPYAQNSITAFTKDYDASKQVFHLPYIGLTAASVVNKIYKDGWIDHNRYISNQGSFGHGTDNPYDVVQTAPAPYGNALALPFLASTGQALESLKNYIEQGFVHPLVGLPDNIQMANTGGLAPIPSWKLLDINVGSTALAIEQYLRKDQYGIAGDYLKDNAAKRAYEALLASWAHSSTANSAREEAAAVVETSEPVRTEVVCSPNPSYDGEFVLDFSIADAGYYQGMLVDMNGTVMAKPEWIFDKPGHYSVQFHELAKARVHGVFLLAVRGPKTSKLIKLIVR